MSMDINKFLEENTELREVFNTQAKLNGVMQIAIDYRDTLFNQLINEYIKLKNEYRKLKSEYDEANKTIQERIKELKGE